MLLRKATRVGVITGVIVIALLLVGAVGYWIGGGSNGSSSNPAAHSTTPATTPAGGSSSTAASETSRASTTGCNVPGKGQSVPTAEPAGVKWKNVDRYWVPISKTAGPMNRSTSGAWTCFAHTPTGAILAGWVVQARLNGAKDLHDVVKHQLVPGPDTPSAEALVAANKAPVAPLPMGFSVVAYTPSQATIGYVMQQGSNGVVQCNEQLEWYKGDWRQVVGQGGALTTGCTADPAAGSYVPWSVS